MSKPTVISLNNAINQLQSGHIGVIPTDTQYGLAAQAANQAAVGRLYALKHRQAKPGTIIAANIAQLAELGLKARYLKAVEGFWPNPISVVIPTGHELAYLHLGKQSLAVRIPDDTALQGFLLQTGPLLTTSANASGQKPAGTIGEAIEYFGTGVDFYVDGGDLNSRQPSTVIRMVDDAVEVLRAGAVTVDEATGRVTPR